MPPMTDPHHDGNDEHQCGGGHADVVPQWQHCETEREHTRHPDDRTDDMFAHALSIVQTPKVGRDAMKRLLRRFVHFEEPMKYWATTLASWQISTQQLVSLGSPSRCSASFGRWTAYEFFPDTPPHCFGRDVLLHRLRDVQAREVLNGFLPHAPRARGGAGSGLALSRFVHGRGLRRSRPLPRLRRASYLLGPRHQSRARNRPGSATPAR